MRNYFILKRMINDYTRRISTGNYDEGMESNFMQIRHHLDIAMRLMEEVSETRMADIRADKKKIANGDHQ